MVAEGLGVGSADRLDAGERVLRDDKTL